jgi:hypothetical protein
VDRGACGEGRHLAIAALLGLGKVEERIQRASPHSQGKRHVFVGHKGWHAQAVQRATTLRTGLGNLPGETRRHEQVGEGKVATPCPLQPHDLPVVMDLHRRHGHHHPA